jgi:hypothetical protein
MQALIQRAQGQGTDVQVCQFLAHLAQADGQGAPTPDLIVDVIPDALIGMQQPAKVNANTPPALTPHAGQIDPQC